MGQKPQCLANLCANNMPPSKTRAAFHGLWLADHAALIRHWIAF